MDANRYLIVGLVKALDWIDNSLQAILEQKGFQAVHRTQSLILIHIASGLSRPCEIADEMGHARQNVHHFAKPLIDAGLIEQARDPDDGRSVIYRFSPDADEIRAAATEAFDYLESVLRTRIGDDLVTGLQEALAADWGSEVKTLP